MAPGKNQFSYFLGLLEASLPTFTGSGPHYFIIIKASKLGPILLMIVSPWFCLFCLLVPLRRTLWLHLSHLDAVQFSSVTQSCPSLCDPMNHSIPGLPVHHQLPESTQTNVHWVGDAIQPSHSLSSPSPPAPNPSQYQGPFQWVSSLHQVARVLKFQLQHQSFQWTPRSDLL